MRLTILLFLVSLTLSTTALANKSGRSFFNQGNQFLHGTGGVSADPRRAFGFFEQSARLGFGPGQFQLGLSFLEGRGVDRNFSQALHFLQLADQQRILGAGHHLGRIHHFGFGVPRNSFLARRYYVQSINDGYEGSADTLASLHLSQIDSDILNESLEGLLEKHARDGDAVAQYNLGYSYYIGLNREKNHRQAAIWFLKAASLSDVDAQFMLGQLYMKGQGVEQNDEQCFIWTEVAKKNGHKDADENLEKCRLKLSQKVLQQVMVEAESLASVF